MSKPTTKPTEDTKPEAQAPKKRVRRYTFPDIDGGGPSVVIEATSLQEATDLFVKGQA